jgi:hypothetical protein
MGFCMANNWYLKYGTAERIPARPSTHSCRLDRASAVGLISTEFAVSSAGFEKN